MISGKLGSGQSCSQWVAVLIAEFVPEAKPQSLKERFLERFPEAWSQRTDEGWLVFRRQELGVPVAGEGPTEEDAWEDAARKDAAGL